MAVESLLTPALKVYELVKPAKGRHIEVLCVTHASLVTISKTIRDKIAISFDGKNVDDLTLWTLSIRNTSPDMIDDVNLEIEFPGSKILSVAPLKPPKQVPPQLTYDSDKLSVVLPYLNSFQPHKEVSDFQVICDGDCSTLIVAGRGKNWTARFSRPNNAVWKPMGMAIVLSFFLGYGGILAAIALANYARSLSSEVLSVFCAIAAFIVGMVGCLGIMGVLMIPIHYLSERNKL